MSNIPISEIFYSLQGEGPDIGKPTIFVRVFGCNAIPPCPWCDSMYAVKKQEEEIIRYTTDEVIKKIDNSIPNGMQVCRDITFTGGEPFLYIEQIQDIIRTIKEKGSVRGYYTFHFETNGLIRPRDMFYNFCGISYVISPKFHLMIDNEKEYINSLRLWLEGQTNRPIILKFVYEGKDTIENIDILESKIYGLKEYPIYLMPEGNGVNIEKYAECAEQCKRYGYIMSPRLQNVIWGPKRGV